MKLEARSKRLLGLSKATAKLVELEVRPDIHPPLADNPVDLLILTIGILGRLSALVARGQEAEEFYALKADLADVAVYFDTLDNSKLLDEIAVYLRVAGSAAYYLADMPGSSAVLAKHIPENFELSPSRLEGVLVWILKSDHRRVWYRLPGSYVDHASTELVSNIYRFYEGTCTDSEVWDSASRLHSVVYESGSDRDLLFSDVISALVKTKLRNSCWTCLPKYSGLTVEAWLPTLTRLEFMKELWPAQRLMGESGILKGMSAVVQMPTSAGKSRAMELIVRSALLSSRAKLIVIVAPFRALCAEISANFKTAFLPDGILVNELPDLNQVTETDTAFLKFLFGDAYKDRSKGIILVSTPEKLAYLFRHEEELSTKIDLLLFDEGHQFDTGKRGVTYELLITYLRTTVSVTTQKVMISAVIANAKSIGDWLNFESGINIQGAKLIPTIRALGFVNWLPEAAEGGLQFYDQHMQETDRYFVPGLLNSVTIPESKGRSRVFPDANNSREIASYLALKFCHLGGAAIFCGTKVIVKSVCRDLVYVINRRILSPLPIETCDVHEISKIHYLAKLHMGACEYTQAIELGVLPHSTNVPAGIRSSVEWALANDKCSLVVCTSTLAQGVNLPIRYLLITSTFQAGNEISNRDFQNLMGRAGRSGYYTEGNVIFTDRKVYDEHWSRSGLARWSKVQRLVDSQYAEHCLSSLKGLIDALPSPGQNIDPLDFLTRSETWIDSANELSKRATDKYLKRDIEALLYEMRSRVERFRALESYIITSIGDGQTSGTPDIEQLATSTLAFSLSSQVEKQAIINVFIMAFNKVMQLDPQMFKAYGRSLLGVDQLVLIEDWLLKNSFDVGFADSTSDMLSAIWPLILLLCPRSAAHKYAPEDLATKMALAWITGTSYADILAIAKDAKGYYKAGKQKRTITIDHIIEFTDKLLGYETMLLVGGIADILEAKSQMSSESFVLLRQLQGSLKYGLETTLEISLYTGGYPDREIVKSIYQELQKVNPDRELNWKDVVDGKAIIDKVLVNFPSVFTH
jgi:hypothetical protein